MSPKSKKEIKEALKKEIGSDLIPPGLKFVIPKFHIKGQQEYAIAKIAGLVDELFPDSHCNAVNIYRILIDELHRKGILSYDYTKWDDLLAQKALTSNKVRSTILTHTSLRNNYQLLEDLDQICSELGFNFMEKRSIKKSIERIHLERIGFPSAFSVRIKKVISDKLKTIMSSVTDINKVIEEVESKLTKSFKDSIGSYLEVKALIIYEILVSDI